MKLTRLLAASTLSLSLLPSAARAQVQTPPAAAPDQGQAEAAQAAQAEREGKALKLLEEIGAEAAGLRLPENRVRAQATVAELLWPHDEEAAREIFRAAQTSLAAIAAAVAPDDPRYQQSAQSANNLRREVVQVVANRDPKLALELLRSTRLPPPPASSNRNFYQPDAELQLETQLAEQVAARDPKEALRMAEESLSRGISGNLPGIIERVRQSDPQAAARLASDVARRLRTVNFSTNYEAASVASYLLRASRPPDAPPQPAAVQPGSPTVYVNSLSRQGQLALDEQARRDLLTTIVNAALAPSAEQGRGRGGRPLYGMLQQLMPEIERLMPAQATNLRRRMSEGGAGGDPAGPRARAREYEQLMSTGTADVLIDAAGKAPAEMRAGLYRAAAAKALNEGQAERARQIASTHFEGGERDQLLREIDQQLFWRASERGEVEQALALMGRFRSQEERASMLLGMARILAGREGRREVVERLLEEVWAQAGGRARTQAQFSAQLQVAQIYALFTPARAFEIVESCVEHLNELLAAAAVVDGFGQDAFDQGELKGEGYLWTMLVQQAGEQLGQLAVSDFERAVSTADRFQRPEARLRARLGVARGVLARDTLGSRTRRLNSPRRPRAGNSQIIDRDE